MSVHNRTSYLAGWVLGLNRSRTQLLS